MVKLEKGDKVRYVYTNGSYDEGILIQPKRKDGYCVVRFGWCGMQLIRPSKLTKAK